MLSKPIFKQTLKANFKLWFIFTFIMSVLYAVIIAVFDQKMISSVSDMVKDTPLAAMMGSTTFLGMLAQTYYSIHGVILPLVFIIMTANSLIAVQVDRGSMAYLLSTPTKRSVVVRTQAIYLVSSLVAMFVIISIVGVLAVSIFQADVDLNLSDLLMLNVGLFLLMFATSSISFLFSCIFNLSKNSLAFGAGIPLAFFLFELMAKVDSSLEAFQYISLNALFDTNAIINDGSYLIQFITLAIIGVILYVIGMRIFIEKDLPL